MKPTKFDPPNWYSKNAPEKGGNPRFYDNKDQGTTARATPADRKSTPPNSKTLGRIT